MTLFSFSAFSFLLSFDFISYCTHRKLDKDNLVMRNDGSRSLLGLEFSPMYWIFPQVSDILNNVQFLLYLYVQK